MKAKATEGVRRVPTQQRSRQTVEAIVEAVVRILKREGVDGVTTNRVAEVAGVSIGSVYQYFPDKRAIFGALHDRHVEQISRLIEGTLVAHAASPFDDLVRALVEALVEAHASEPELHELLMTEVPNRGGARAFESRLRDAFTLAIAARTPAARPARDQEQVLFILPHMVEALAHGAALRRPPGLTRDAVTREAVHAVMAYLRV